MRRLWPVTRFLLLLAAGYLAVEGGIGLAAVGVLGWWVWYWGWREPARYICADSSTIALGAPAVRFPPGTVIAVNRGNRNESRLIVVRAVGPRELLVARPGRWVR